jgi:hypothetical protein
MSSRFMIAAAFALLACVRTQAAFADDVPKEWQSCTKTEDCTAVRDSKTCNVAAVNKSHADEAMTFLAKQPGAGPVKSMDGSIRCVNAPDAVCTDNVCQLIVHPE